MAEQGTVMQETPAQQQVIDTPQEQQVERVWVNIDEEIAQHQAAQQQEAPAAAPGEEQRQATGAAPAAPAEAAAPAQEQPAAAAEEELPVVRFAPAKGAEAAPQQAQQELKPEDIVQKVQDKKVLLKALGLDDYLIGAIDYYQQTGDLTPYLEVKSVDYSKLSDVEIMRRSLREDVAGMNLTDEQFELLFSSRVLKKYKQDEPDAYTESEVAVGKLELSLDAAAKRKAFIEKQQQFAPPPRPEAQEQQAAPQPTREQLVESAKSRVLTDQGVQRFLQNRIIEIGEGDESFKFEAKNPKAVLSILYDPDQMTYYTSQKDEQGNVLVDEQGVPIPDYNFLLEIASHIQDRAAYNKYLVSHGKSLEAKRFAEGIAPEERMGGAGTTPVAQELDEWQLIAKALKEKNF